MNRYLSSQGEFHQLKERVFETSSTLTSKSSKSIFTMKKELKGLRYEYFLEFTRSFYDIAQVLYCYRMVISAIDRENGCLKC